jgi:hypothetical protein
LFKFVIEICGLLSFLSSSQFDDWWQQNVRFFNKSAPGGLVVTQLQLDVCNCTIKKKVVCILCLHFYTFLSFWVHWTWHVYKFNNILQPSTLFLRPIWSKFTIFLAHKYCINLWIIPWLVIFYLRYNWVP